MNRVLFDKTCKILRLDAAERERLLYFLIQTGIEGAAKEEYDDLANSSLLDRLKRHDNRMSRVLSEDLYIRMVHNSITGKNLDTAVKRILNGGEIDEKKAIKAREKGTEVLQEERKKQDERKTVIWNSLIELVGGNKTKADYSNPEEALAELLLLCKAENEDLFRPTAFKKLKNAAKTYGFEEVGNNLKELLGNSDRICIKGSSGSGKTRFLKWFFTVNEYDCAYYSCDDVRILAEDENWARKVVAEIEKKMYPYQDTEKFLSGRFSDSVLVIDNFPLLTDQYKEDIRKLVEGLEKYKLKIIIIVHGCYHPLENFNTLSIPELTEEDLKKIFMAESGTEAKGDSWTDLLDCVKTNPYAVSIVARMTREKAACDGYTFDRALNEIIEELRIPEKRSIVNVTTDNNPRFKVEYDNQSISGMAHIRSVYNKLLWQQTNPELNAFFEVLCCFGTSPIAKSFLKEILGEDIDEVLKLLAQSAFITDEEDSVIISPLMVYSVTTGISDQSINRIIEKPGLLDNIINFLRSYRKKLSVPYVGNSLVCFASTLEHGIRQVTAGRKHKSESKHFEKWQQFLLQTVMYCIDMGALNEARTVREYLKYPMDLFKHDSPLDQKLLRIIDSFIDKEKTDEVFGDYIDSFRKEKDTLTPFNRHWLVLYYFGTQQYDFYLTVFTGGILQKDQNLYRSATVYLQKWVVARNKLFGSNSQLIDQIEDYREKGRYYEVVNDPVIEKEALEKQLSEIDKFSCADNRIKGYAVMLTKLFIQIRELQHISEQQEKICCEILEKMFQQLDKCAVVPQDVFNMVYHAIIEMSEIRQIFSNPEYLAKSDRLKDRMLQLCRLDSQYNIEMQDLMDSMIFDDIK